jgi:hypothetical protein
VHQLLRFLLLRCSFLWEGSRYRIVDSRGASITVASADVQLYFTCRRGAVEIDVEPVRAGPVSGRYALRTLCALIGATGCSDDAALLHASLTDIEVLFGGAPLVPIAGRRPAVCRT